MKIGFNKETYMLVFDLLILGVIIESAFMPFGYFVKSEPIDITSVFSMALIGLAGVLYLLIHSLSDDEEKTTK